MSTSLTGALEPMRGPEKAVPWPTPPIPGTEMLTFWGSGDATTQPFTLPGDASVRIAVEKGPLAVRVLRSDGSDAASIAPIQNQGLGLGAIPEGGTYTLDVRTGGSWGITIVFMTPK